MGQRGFDSASVSLRLTAIGIEIGGCHSSGHRTAALLAGSESFVAAIKAHPTPRVWLLLRGEESINESLFGTNVPTVPAKAVKRMYPKICIPVCAEPTLLSKMARHLRHSSSHPDWTPATLSVGSQMSPNELNHIDARVDYASLPALSPNLVNEDAGLVCKRCNLAFPDITTLNDHLTNTVYHHWCFICSRDFHSSTAFAQHNVSLAHKDRDMKCPFCEELFKSPSGVAFHIESGCHGVNRRQVTAAIHSLRIIPTISVSHRIEGPSIQTEPVDTTITTLIATEDSFDVLTSSYVCLFCAHHFTSLRALNRHLNSPAHDDKEFKCPKAKCGREFKLISGFVQHIESGACGASKMKGVEQYYEDLTAAFTRALTM